MPYRFPDAPFCRFCECIAGRLPWFPLVEEEHAVALLNPRQRMSGATLIAPRRHVHAFSELTAVEARAILGLALAMSERLQSALTVDGIHVFCNSGVAAGQSEPHAHVQVIPRYADQPYTFVSSRTLEIARPDDLTALSKKLMNPVRSPLTRLAAARETRPSECRVCREIQDASCVVLDAADYFVAIVPERCRARGSAVIASRRCIPGPDSLTGDEQVELVKLIQSTAKAIERTYDPDGLNIWWDLGAIAGQIDFHYCVELVPRFDNVPYKYTSLLEIPTMPTAIREKIAHEFRGG